MEDERGDWQIINEVYTIQTQMYLWYQ